MEDMKHEEMKNLFNKIKNPIDWKLDIEAMILKKKFNDYDDAVMAFTGGGLKIVTPETKDGMVGVVGYGYYHHIGG